MSLLISGICGEWNGKFEIGNIIVGIIVIVIFNIDFDNLIYMFYFYFYVSGWPNCSFIPILLYTVCTAYCVTIMEALRQMYDM